MRYLWDTLAHVFFSVCVALQATEIALDVYEWKHVARRRHQSITHRRRTHHSTGNIFSASHSDRLGATRRSEMWDKNIVLQAIVFQFLIISKTINELHGYLLHMDTLRILIQNQSQINASTRFYEDTCVVLMARVCDSQDKKEKCTFGFFVLIKL